MKRKTCTSAEMARIFDCSARQIERLAAVGIVVRSARGEYDFDKSVPRYCRHLRELAAERVGADGSLAAAYYERTLAQIDFLKMKRRKLEEDLVPIETAREVWRRISDGLRRFVTGLPDVIAGEVTLTPHDLGTVKKLCADGLVDAALERGFTMALPNN